MSEDEPEVLDIQPFYLLLAAMVEQAADDIRHPWRGYKGQRLTPLELLYAKDFLAWARESFADRLRAR